MRNNEEYWSELILKQAIQITTKLGDRRVHRPLAISSQIYTNLRLTQELGFVTNYNDLKNIADIFHIHVPLLTQEHYYRMERDNGMFAKITARDQISTKNAQRDRFYQMYEQILKNMISLINNDSLISI